MTTHKGKCFCGSVEIEVQGAPEAMGYCHCSSCRSWASAPVNAFTLWKPQNVRVTGGAEHLGKFAKTETSHRQYCRRCGGHIMTDHPPLGLVDVYAATIPTLKFTPGVHVNYAETVLPMKDGLPKLRDFPAELGGSGVAVAEWSAALDADHPDRVADRAASRPAALKAGLSIFDSTRSPLLRADAGAGHGRHIKPRRMISWIS